MDCEFWIRVKKNHNPDPKHWSVLSNMLPSQNLKNLKVNSSSGQCNLLEGQHRNEETSSHVALLTDAILNDILILRLTHGQFDIFLNI